MNRPVVDSVNHSPIVEISLEEGESCGAGRSGSIFRFLLDLDARLRKQRREESKNAFGRRQIFRADRIR
jgi:hypothetical protein